MAAPPPGSRDPFALDPRTVGRQILLERAGSLRPALSLLHLWAPGLGTEPGDCCIPQIPGRSVQTLLALDGPASEQQEGQRRQGSGAKPVVWREPTEALPLFLNRAARGAIGEVLVMQLGPGPLPAHGLADLWKRFVGEIALGLVALDPGALAVRGDLWTALGGLDPDFGELHWALRDLATRARSLGFEAPPQPPPWCPRPDGAVAGDDAERWARRASAAPDCSRTPEGSGRPRPAGREGVVYTAITNRHDALKPQPQRFFSGAAQVAFLDPPTAEQQAGRHRGWQIEERWPPLEEPRRGSRFYKANSHRIFPAAAFSLWIDASIVIVSPLPLLRLVELFLAEADLCVFRHHVRGSIAQEAEACKRLGLDDPRLIDRQLERYRREGMPPSCGLAELPVILRRHTPAVRAFNERWWQEIRTGSHRDQLSFDYVAWKLGLRYATFPLSVASGNGLFLKFQRAQAAAVASPQ